nr:TEL2 family protein [Acidobacteriota bacterium]
PDSLWGLGRPGTGAVAGPAHLVRYLGYVPVLLSLVFLPGRVFPAYCYLPLTGVAIAIAGLISLGEKAYPRATTPLVIVVFAIWMRADIRELRRDRSATLAADNGTRAFVSAIENYAKAHPQPLTVVYDSVPPGLHHWGVTAAVNIAYHQSDMQSRFIDSPEARAALKNGPVTFMSWDETERRVHFTARAANTNEAVYIAMGHDTPLWQLVSGWLGLDGYFQWIEPQAIAYLRRPSDANRFELNVNVSPELIRKTGHANVEVRLNGVEIGARDFTVAGRQSVVWPLPKGNAGQTRVDFQVTPEFKANAGDRKLGIAIVSFGFLSPEAA